jgi:UDP-2,3-diacylglucosamine hydrolase
MLLFFSDTHFGIGSPQVQEDRRNALFACLDHHLPALDQLIIMGDLFDFWFEWRHVILKQHFKVLSKLAQIRSRGVEIHYLAGNHDFALTRFLQDEIGAVIHPESHQFESGGKRFYLFHGDGLSPADWAYRALRKVLRNPVNQKLYSWFHPDVGLELAHLSSHTSRNHSGRRWDIDGASYHESACQKTAEGFDYVIYAHTHEPLLQPAGSGIYVNTGDWLKYNSYATFDNGVMTLKYWGKPWIERKEDRAPSTEHRML